MPLYNDPRLNPAARAAALRKKKKRDAELAALNQDKAAGQKPSPPPASTQSAPKQAPTQSTMKPLPQRPFSDKEVKRAPVVAPYLKKGEPNWAGRKRADYMGVFNQLPEDEKREGYRLLRERMFIPSSNVYAPNATTGPSSPYLKEAMDKGLTKAEKERLHALTNQRNAELPNSLYAEKQVTPMEVFLGPDFDYLKDRLKQNPSGSAKNPSKKAPWADELAYVRTYAQEDWAFEKKAKSEMSAFQQALAAWAKDPANAGKPNKEIIDTFDWEQTGIEGGLAFPTLKAYWEAYKDGVPKWNIEGGVYIDYESQSAVIDAARRGEDVSVLRDYVGGVAGRQNAEAQQAAAKKAAGIQPEKIEPNPRPLSAWEQFGRAFNETGMRVSNGLADAAEQFGYSFNDAGRIISDFTADNFAPNPDTLPDPLAEINLDKRLEQSVTTTGKIDLRWPDVPRSMWQWLVDNGLASKEQMDALLAPSPSMSQQNQAITVPVPGIQKQPSSPAANQPSPSLSKQKQAMIKTNTQAPMSLQPRALTASDMPLSDDVLSGMSRRELAAYKSDLIKKWNLLDWREQDRAEIIQLETDLKNETDSDKIADITARLKAAYDRRDAQEPMDPEVEQAAYADLTDEINKVTRAIEASAPKAPVPAQSIPEQKDEPKLTAPLNENAEQYTTRLASTHIADLEKENDLLTSTKVAEAAKEYARLTEWRDNLWHNASERAKVIMRRDILANTWVKKGIDISDPDKILTAQIRKQQEMEDAAVIQYSTLRYVMTDYEMGASRGRTLQNAEIDVNSLVGMDKLPDTIKNPVVFAKDNAKAIRAAIAANEHIGGLPTINPDKRLALLYMLRDMSYMTEDQRDDYGYLLQNPLFGSKAADLYFEGLRPGLTAAQGKEFYNAYLAGHPWRTFGYSLLANFGQSVGNISRMKNPYPVDPSAGTYAAMYANAGLDNSNFRFPDWAGGGSVSQFANEIFSSTGYIAPAAIANLVAPGSGLAYLLGSTYGGAYDQSLQEGHTVSQAQTFSALKALSETFTEGAIGLGVVGGGAITKLFINKQVANVATSAFNDFANALWKRMLSNGTEEDFQVVMEKILRAGVYGDKFEGVNFADPQAIRSFLIGSATAAFLEAPEIIEMVEGTKYLGESLYRGEVPLNDPRSLSAMVIAGKFTSPLEATAEKADQVIGASGGTLDPYRTGKLFKSLMGNDEAIARYDKLMKEQRWSEGERYGKIDTEASLDTTEEALKTSPAAPAEPVLPELTTEEKLAVSVAAQEVARRAAEDESKYPFILARLSERVKLLNKTVEDSLKGQLDALTQAKELEDANTATFADVANHKADAASVIQGVTENIKKIAELKTAAENYKNNYLQAQSELQSALVQYGYAMGDFRDGVYFEAKTGITTQMRKDKAAAQQKTEAAAAEEANLQAARTRMPEVEARIKELEEQDIGLALDEDQAKKRATEALATENKATLENEEAAKESAQTARDNYTGIRKKRSEIAKELENLKKERTSLADLLSKAPVPSEQGKAAQPSEPHPIMDRLRALPKEKPGSVPPKFNQEEVIAAFGDLYDNDPKLKGIVEVLTNDLVKGNWTFRQASAWLEDHDYGVEEPIIEDIEDLNEDTTPGVSSVVNEPEQPYETGVGAYEPSTVAEESETSVDQPEEPLDTDYERMVLDPRDLLVDDETFPTYPLTGGASSYSVSSGDTVIYRRTNGDMYFAGGRAALDGATSVNAAVYDESAGYSPEDVRFIAAARDLSLSLSEPINAAKVLRAANISIGSLKRYGITPKTKSSVMRRGAALSRLAPQYWRLLMSGSLDQSTGYVMGSYFPNDYRMQAAFMSFLANRGGTKVSESTKEEYASILQANESGERPVVIEQTIEPIKPFQPVKGRTRATSGGSPVAIGEGETAETEPKQAPEPKRAKEEAPAPEKAESEADVVARRTAFETSKKKLEPIPQIKIGKPTTTRGRTEISVQLRDGPISDWRELKLVKQPDNTGWSVIRPRETSYSLTGGETETRPLIVYGRDLDLNTAKRRAVFILEDWYAKNQKANSAAAEPATETKPAEPGTAVDNSLMMPGAASAYPPLAGNKSVPIQRVSKTAKELYKAIGVYFTSKKQPAMLKKYALGMYLIHPGVVITRTHQDVNVYAHELGHAIFDRLKAFNPNGTPTAAFATAINQMVANLPIPFKVLYDPQVWGMEASAHFMNLYLTDRNAAINFSSDTFVQDFEKMLTPKHLKALTDARAKFRAFIDSDLRTQFENRVVSHQDVRGAHGPFWRGLTQKFADEYQSALMFDLAAHKAGYDNRLRGNRVSVLLDNTKYAQIRAGNMLEKIGLCAPNGNKIAESFADALSSIGADRMHAFGTYWLAKHDLERQKHDVPVFGGYTLKDVQTVVNGYEAEHPDFLNILKNLVHWNDLLMDEWVIKPNIVPNAARKFKVFRDKYEFYAPSPRVMSDEADDGDAIREAVGDLGGTLGKSQLLLRRARGGDQAVFDPIESMAARVIDVVTAYEKEMAKRKIHEICRTTKGLGDWLFEVENGADEKGGQMMRVVDRVGDIHYYKVNDPLMYKMLFAEPDTDLGIGLTWLGTLSNGFKQLVTTLDPAFILKNTSHDFSEGLLKSVTLNPVKYTADWIKAIGKLTKANTPKANMPEAARLYYAMGGGDSSISPRTPNEIAHLERALYSGHFKNAMAEMFKVKGKTFGDWGRDTKDVLGSIKDSLTGPIKTMNAIMESSQRLAEFMRVYEATGDLEGAFHASNEVTLNFRRKGSWKAIKATNVFFVFSNAALQATYSLVRMAQEAPLDPQLFTKRLIKSVALFALLPLLTKAIRDRFSTDEEKEKYKALAANVKAENEILPKSIYGPYADLFPGRDFIMLPKARNVLAGIGDTMGRALIEALENEKNWDSFVAYGMQDYAKTSLYDFVTSINPYGSPLFGPVMQLWLNRDHWGTPIEPEYMRYEGLSPINKVKENTSAVAIYLASLPGLRDNVSPIQVDHFIKQSFGVAGRYIAGDVGNAAMDVVQGKQPDYKFGKFTADRMRNVLMTDPTVASEFTSSVYDAFALLTGIVADANADVPTGNKYAKLNPALTDEEKKQAVVMAKNLIRKGGHLAVAKARTSNYYKQMTKIEESTTMTKAEKDGAIYGIKWQMIKENGLTMIEVENEFIRKYIKGTPAKYKRIYGG